MRRDTDILAPVLIAAALVAATSPGWHVPLAPEAPLAGRAPAASRSTAFLLAGSDGREPRREGGQDRADMGRSESR
jgi:hypothetical protein